MNILVTGATRGIGFSIYKKLKDSGHQLYITARNENRLKELSEYYCVCDLATKEGVQKLGEYIQEKNTIQLMK
jgi:short-subunit dehydrogenase